MILSIFALAFISTPAFAEDIYQDENGVWTNIPKSQKPSLPQTTLPISDEITGGITGIQRILQNYLSSELMKTNTFDWPAKQEEERKGIYRSKEARLRGDPILPDALEYERFDDPRDHKK